MFLKTAEPGNNSYPNALPSKRQRGWFRRFDPRSFTRAAVALPFPRFQRLPRHLRDTPSLTMVPYGRASWFVLSGTAPALAARACIVRLYGAFAPLRGAWSAVYFQVVHKHLSVIMSRLRASLLVMRLPATRHFLLRVCLAARPALLVRRLFLPSPPRPRARRFLAQGRTNEGCVFLASSPARARVLRRRLLVF